MEQFETWAERHAPELKVVEGLLGRGLPDDAEGVWNALREIEAHYGRLQYLVAQADAYLDVAERRELNRVIRENTEKLAAYEKEVNVKAAVSGERQFRDYVQGLLEAVKQRVMLGQSRMRYLRDLYADAPVRGRGE
ncbi:MAG: hypothetical protein M0R06_21605 [Sphaerochaeta sp.]|nr:hypothetical protein [Sphaerochaeta sp.]